MAPGLDDLLEERITPVLDIAQIGRGLRPGQVALEGLAQINAQETGAYKGEVVNAQRSGVLHHECFRARWPTPTWRRRRMKQRCVRVRGKFPHAGPPKMPVLFGKTV